MIDALTASLLCEGACNPRLTTFDAKLNGVRGDDPRSSLEAADLAAATRAAVYTEHEAVSETVWRCTACGQLRRFGGNPDDYYARMLMAGRRIAS